MENYVLARSSMLLLFKKWSLACAAMYVASYIVLVVIFTRTSTFDEMLSQSNASAAVCNAAGGGEYAVLTTSAGVIGYKSQLCSEIFFRQQLLNGRKTKLVAWVAFCVYAVVLICLEVTYLVVSDGAEIPLLVAVVRTNLGQLWKHATLRAAAVGSLAEFTGAKLNSRMASKADRANGVVVGNGQRLENAHVAKIMKLRSVYMQFLQNYYENRGFPTLLPQTLVQNQVGGGSTLFKFKYFDDEACLTQLYLETTLPANESVRCIAQLYRAEHSRTRRHSAEYSRVGGERPFITFTELLDHLEDLICGVAEEMLESPHADLMKQLNPNFKMPERPFMRMDYTEAIRWLNQHGIKKEKDGSNFVFGDDIPEKPERHMTDTINKPIMLIGFPAAIKSFYMPREKAANRVTENVDVLIPNVGTIVGGLMLTSNDDASLTESKLNVLDSLKYKNLRKYGTSSQGGYELEHERLLEWILGGQYL